MPDFPLSQQTDLGLLKAQDCCGESVFSPYPAWTPSHEESRKLVRDGEVAAEAPGPGKLQRAETYRLPASRGCAVGGQTQTWGMEAHLSSPVPTGLGQMV